MASRGLHDRYLAVLRELGGHAGNGRMRESLGWQEGTYAKVSKEVRQAGLVSAGRGRGGSVSLIGTQNAEILINGSEPAARRAVTKLRLERRVDAARPQSGVPRL